jgi:uncharacterized protein
MFFDINIVYGILIVFFASVLQGIMGFGYAIIAGPLLMLLFSPKLVVPVILIQTTFNCFIIIYLLKNYIKKYFNSNMILRLAITGIIGIPIGTFLLVSVTAAMIKIIAGIVIVFYSVTQLFDYRKSIENENVGYTVVGFLSGILVGSIGMSGPPVVLFLTNQNVKKDSFRVNIILYFIIVGLIAILSMYFSDIINIKVINYFLLFFPAMVFGAILGNYFSKKANEIYFRKATILIILISGILAIISSLNII